MEESAAAAYYFSGGRNNWSFTNLEGVAQFSGKLTFDVGSLVVGPETLLLKSGAQSAKIEALIARERSLNAETNAIPPVKLDPEGSLPSELLPDNIRGDGIIEHPGTVRYPDGISFNVNLEKHVAKADGYSQKSGISGAHNAADFDVEAKARGAKINSATPTGVPGIVEITYQIPALDEAGNVIGFKSGAFKKTVYDPAVYSDRKILVLGQQAAADGYKQAVAAGNRQYTRRQVA